VVEVDSGLSTDPNEVVQLARLTVLAYGTRMFTYLVQLGTLVKIESSPVNSDLVYVHVDG